MKKLSNKDISNTKKRYSERFSTYGHDQRSVGWGEKGRQLERFKILLDSIKLDPSQKYDVLDIGAGFGDLFNFLRKSSILVNNYRGYELVEELVKEGTKTYGINKNFELLNEDFLGCNQSNNKRFDVAYMSGCFNFKLLDGSNYVYIENCLKKALQLCRVGVTANFITNRVDYEEDYIFYSDPKRIIDIAYELSMRFTIDHSYFPYEFTIAILKDQSYSKSYPVFADQRLS